MTEILADHAPAPTVGDLTSAERFVQVRPALVRALGGDPAAAMLLQHVRWRCEGDPHWDGLWRDPTTSAVWARLTWEDMEASTGLRLTTVRRVLGSLIDRGLVQRRRVGNVFDRAWWYRVDPDTSIRVAPADGSGPPSANETTAGAARMIPIETVDTNDLETRDADGAQPADPHLFAISDKGLTPRATTENATSERAREKPARRPPSAEAFGIAGRVMAGRSVAPPGGRIAVAKLAQKFLDSGVTVEPLAVAMIGASACSQGSIEVQLARGKPKASVTLSDGMWQLGDTPTDEGW